MNRTVPLLQEAGLDGDLRAVLDAAADHEPSPADLAKLASRLSGALPPGTMPPAPSTPPPLGSPPGSPPLASPPAGTSVAGKLMVVLAIGGAVAGAVWLAERAPLRATSAPAEARPSERHASDAAALLAVAPSGDRDPGAVSPATPIASVSASERSSPLQNERRDPPKGAARSVQTSAPEIAPALPEGKLLARAHEALLRGDANEALATTSEHAKAYPRGGLVQEREVIAIEALASLGRLEEARRRAQAFRVAYPGSSHLAQIERVVAVERGTKAPSERNRTNE